MRTATVGEAKRQLEDLVNEVRQGRTVELTENGSVVARLIPPYDAEAASSGAEAEETESWLAELEERGIIARSESTAEERAAARRFLLENPPVEGFSGVLDQLLEERRGSR